MIICQDIMHLLDNKNSVGLHVILTRFHPFTQKFDFVNASEMYTC